MLDSSIPSASSTTINSRPHLAETTVPLMQDTDLPKFTPSPSPSLSDFEIEEDLARPPSSSSSISDTSTLSKYLASLHAFYTRNLGLLLIILSQFFNSTMVVTTKLLVKDPAFKDDPIHPAQVLFVRMIITSAGCYAYLKYVMKVDNVFGPREIRVWLVARGAFGFVGVFSLYYSLMYLSVSDAVTITFLVPSITGFLAWVLLRERWSLREALGGLVSLLGVLLIARPSFIFGSSIGSGDDQIESSVPAERVIGTLVSLCGAFGASGAYIIIRKIRGKVHSLITVHYFAMICVAITFIAIIVVPGLSFKTPQTLKQWLLFFGLGISGFCMQFLLTEGIMREKASRASAMLYVQIIYSLFWELVIWGHLPGFSSFCGIAIILGTAYFVIAYKPNEDNVKPVDLESQVVAEAQKSVRLEDYPNEERR